MPLILMCQENSMSFVPVPNYMFLNRTFGAGQFFVAHTVRCSASLSFYREIPATSCIHCDNQNEATHTYFQALPGSVGGTGEATLSVERHYTSPHPYIPNAYCGKVRTKS